MNKVKQIIGVLLLLSMTILLSCEHNEEVHHHNIIEKIEALTTKAQAPTATSDQYYAETKMINIQEHGHDFLIPDRKSQIKSFACSDCHNEPLAELQAHSGAKKAHWDIKLNHANTDIMACTSCHTANDMDHLHSLTGKPIDFNKSYQLCSQCHQQEGKDWLGGAHGKQIGGWANPRASNTCVDCHNPHSPSFEPRWPSRFNTQKVKERQ